MLYFFLSIQYRKSLTTTKEFFGAFLSSVSLPSLRLFLSCSQSRQDIRPRLLIPYGGIYLLQQYKGNKKKFKDKVSEKKVKQNSVQIK